MPKSKRDKKISLTQSKKKGLDFKQALISGIRENLDKYDRLFLFYVRNMRNVALKEVRTHWKQSRFFFGKSKLMALALGRTKESEQGDNVHKLANKIKGQCGLLFTNEKKEDVIEWFTSFVRPEFARSGFQAQKTVQLKEGPLMDFTTSIEPNLRKLGLPTMVKNGKVHLMNDHTVCTAGDILTPAQAQILKLLGECLAQFKITLKCMWCKDGTFEELSKGSDNCNDESDNDVEMEEE
ncbi:hypothetical protein RUM44_006893 [Polyplax serrata]|uniref:Ribosome assembly factor mrt4 n=1 Tax=Polyplax serrata TaxID=468196 RepID=A0ABR1AJC9_POLSC